MRSPWNNLVYPDATSPFPYAAEDNQAYNATVFTASGAALAFNHFPF